MSFKTVGFAPYSLQFSPFFESKIAIASAHNFGIIGNGRLWVLDADQSQVYDTNDALFDLAWSECHEHHIITSGGDGLKLFNICEPDYPIMVFNEHLKECYSVNWNLIQKDKFISSSFDLTLKLWDPNFSKSILTFNGHLKDIYEAIFSPTDPNVFCSAGDYCIKVWDCRLPQCMATIEAHDNQVLSLDWNKYKIDRIVTGSVDNSIKEWDLRMPHNPLTQLYHDMAVRRVKCSPHDGATVASVSYDMTMRLWNMDTGDCVVHDRHTEFAYGLDFSLFKPGQIATCGWDQMVYFEGC